MASGIVDTNFEQKLLSYMREYNLSQSKRRSPNCETPEATIAGVCTNHAKGSRDVDVRLIDFAHAFPGEGERDENSLCGVNNTINCFEELCSI